MGTIEIITLPLALVTVGFLLYQLEKYIQRLENKK